MRGPAWGMRKGLPRVGHAQRIAPRGAKGVDSSRAAFDRQARSMATTTRPTGDYPEPPPRGTVVEDVTERITDLIIRDGLKPGDQLATEKELTARLGVGRSSLREAIKTLCALGVLEIRHGTGTFVSSGSTSMLTRPLKWGLFLSGASVTDVIDARSAIEVALVQWAATRATAEDIARIAAILRDLEAARDDRPRYIEADLAFHMAIAQAARNEMLSTILTMMQHVLRVWMQTIFSGDSNTDHSMNLHRRIFAAIAAHDPAAAAEAMAIHTAGGPLLAAAQRHHPDNRAPLSVLARPPHAT